MPPTIGGEFDEHWDMLHDAAVISVVPITYSCGWNDCRTCGGVPVVCDDRIRLVLADRREATIALQADCCSTSYFTDPSQFEELTGTVIRAVEDRAGEMPVGAKPDEDSVTAWHFLVFTTNKGHVTIDWRNDSNGFYDGWAVLRMEQAAAGDSDGQTT